MLRCCRACGPVECRSGRVECKCVCWSCCVQPRHLHALLQACPHAQSLPPPPSLPAALKERIARLLSAVLPVATSGKESSSAGGGYLRSTTISIRNRTTEDEAPAAKKEGERSSTA